MRIIRENLSEHYTRLSRLQKIQPSADNQPLTFLSSEISQSTKLLLGEQHQISSSCLLYSLKGTRITHCQRGSSENIFRAK
jgi:hypothetical protein